MPLVFRLRPEQDFYVEDERMIVESVGDNGASFELRIASSAKLIHVTDEEAIEVMPDVFISAGDHYQSDMSQVVIDAPRDIQITRGDRYRGGG